MSVADTLLKAWKGGPYVPRTAIRIFSAGLLSPKTMANFDSRGEGPPRIRSGRRVYYLATDLALWIEEYVLRDKAV